MIFLYSNYTIFIEHGLTPTLLPLTYFPSKEKFLVSAFESTSEQPKVFTNKASYAGKKMKIDGIFINRQ